MLFYRLNLPPHCSSGTDVLGTLFTVWCAILHCCGHFNINLPRKDSGANASLTETNRDKSSLRYSEPAEDDLGSPISRSVSVGLAFWRPQAALSGRRPQGGRLLAGSSFQDGKAVVEHKGSDSVSLLFLSIHLCTLKLRSSQLQT